MEPFGTVLGIWAHPDDETYLSAGLMARAADMGRRVVCITATRGEAGSTDAQRWPPGPPLAQVRTAESDAAFELLKVKEHHWLDYPDGGCAEIDQGAAIADILAIAHDVRPDLIVTFGPNGMTGHSDHQAVHRWAIAVASELSPQPRLWHAVHTDDFLEKYGQKLTELGAFMDGEPDSASAADAIVLDLSEDEHERKWQALLSQTSQTEAFFAAFGHDEMRAGIGRESFVEGRG